METNPPAGGVPSRTPPGQTPGGPAPARPRPAPNAWVILIVLAILTAFYLYSRGDGNRARIPYGFFWQQLRDENVAQVEFDGQQLVLGKFRTQPEKPTEPDEQRASSKSSGKSGAADTKSKDESKPNEAQPAKSTTGTNKKEL